METTNGQSKIFQDKPEYGDDGTEQIRTKKKGLHKKLKTHLLEINSDNSSTNGHGFEQDELKKTKNENQNIEIVTEKMTVNHEIDIKAAYDMPNPTFKAHLSENSQINDNGDTNNEYCEQNGENTENTTSMNINTTDLNKDNDQNDAPEETNENDKGNCSIDSNGTESVETECSANDVLLSESSCVTTETENLHGKSINDSIAADTNDVSVSSVNGHDSIEYTAVEVSEVQLNSSKSDEETFFYETFDVGKHSIYQTPQTAPAVVQEDISMTNKISNFFGKWPASAATFEEKQEAEISSSKPNETLTLKGREGICIVHPYLSKVSGRRGIKNLNTNGTTETITPTNKGITLSDSFRVKTDPPRLSQAEVEEPVLRKYKGKRCLNVNDDDYEEGEEAYAATTSKRLKLDEKTSGSWSLWSPFKKRYPDNSYKTAGESRSKLSRFLSPFWFWKKNGDRSQ